MVKNNSTRVLLVKEFVFTAKSEQLYPLLKGIIDTIKTTIGPDFSDSLEGRCRMIITELLTNALKHSNISESLITLVIDKTKITISKSDSGSPFYLNACGDRDAMKWPVEVSLSNSEIIIYEDDMCILKGSIKSPFKINFYTEDLPVQIPPRPKNLLEHFGLMILTKSSDSFTYHYDSENKTNTFQAAVLI